MQHEQIVHQHLERQLRAGARETMARKTTSAPMFFQVCKHDFDRLPTPPVDGFGFLGLHPGLMGNDDVFVLATPKTAAALLARRALRPQRARRGRLRP